MADDLTALIAEALQQTSWDSRVAIWSEKNAAAILATPPGQRLAAMTGDMSAALTASRLARQDAEAERDAARAQRDEARSDRSSLLTLLNDARAERDAARAALRRRTFRKSRKPAHHGEYIEHGLEDEMHDVGEPCDICAAIALHDEETGT